MTNKKQKMEMRAGLAGIMVLIFVVALFVVFFDMLPDVLLFIQTSLGIDEFLAKIVLFIGLLAGIIGFSYIGYMQMPRRRR